MKKLFSVLALIFAAIFLLCSCDAQVQKIDNSAQNTYLFDSSTVYNESTDVTAETTQKTTATSSQKQKEEASQKTEKENKISEKKEKTVKSAVSAESTTHKKTEKEKKLKCTISIDCLTVLQNYSKLKENKKEFVPSGGIILKKTEVEFTEGESVFDVLIRVCKQNGIQTDSSYTPAFGSYYVRGIHQIYEKDCGTKSGWMYSVNGVYPNYGCSSYILKDNDNILWRYTCDNGDDINAVLQEPNVTD